jgi:hypothetical protein
MPQLIENKQNDPVLIANFEPNEIATKSACPPRRGQKIKIQTRKHCAGDAAKRWKFQREKHPQMNQRKRLREFRYAAEATGTRQFTRNLFCLLNLPLYNAAHEMDVRCCDAVTASSSAVVFFRASCSNSRTGFSSRTGYHRSGHHRLRTHCPSGKI